MKLKIHALLLAVSCSLFFFNHAAQAQGTAFTYQGQLSANGGPANGAYDLKFTLFNSASGGSPAATTVTNAATTVSNGLFTVVLDFGGNPYISGASLWLEIGARTNGTGTFFTLLPRQPVTSTPYAAYAYSVNASSLIGQVTDANLSAVLSSPHSFTSSGNSFAGDGSGLTGLNASNILSGTITDGRLSTNVALLNANNVFSGSMKVGSTFALDLRPNNTGADNLFAGPNAGAHNTNGFKNTFVGSGSGSQNRSGSGNTFFGFQAGDQSMTGNSQTMVGNFAGDGNITGDQNTFIGAGAGQNNTNGSFNTFVGTIAELNNMNGSGNIALGYQSGNSHITGNNNIDIGNSGVNGESGVIRIGTTGTHTDTYLAGAVHFNGSQSITNGSVGIGTLTPITDFQVRSSQYGARPVGLFQVSNCGAACAQQDYQENIRLLNDNSNGQTGIGFLTSDSSTINTVPSAWIGTSYGQGAGGNANDLKFATQSGGSLVDRVYIDGATGNVGIGTGSPASKLQVAGDITASSTGGITAGSLATYFSIYLDASGTNNGSVFGSPALVFGGGGSGEGIASKRDTGGNQNGIDLFTSYTPRLSIANNGNVGIGTTAPTNQLEVMGNTSGVAAGASIDSSVFVRVSNSANDGNLSSPDYAGIGFGRDTTRQAIVGGTFGNDYLDFYTGGLLTKPKMRIDFNGNVGIGTNSPHTLLEVAGEVTCTAINLTSDRNAKEEFKTVSAQDVLAKVMALPITEWQYKAGISKDGEGARHIGPMAQDFRDAFALGHDDKHISVVDEGGVALAAIQGLNEKLEEKEARIRGQELQLKSQDAKIQQMSAALQELKQMISEIKAEPTRTKAQ